MGSPIANVGMTLQCPHGAPGQVISTNVRVKVSGMFAGTMADQYMIAGCPFQTPVPKPQPCLKVQWLVPATRVRINGQFAILQSSTGLCLSAEQIPQGPPILVPQVRVTAL